ncbi:hypothetical protein TrLO_g10827 [Triparma laevis f. longispina]|uniref:DUS-like FMN-binding domain-containing protein n=1 Tax=Triparma laevis f. longispina TaxID=1714387 RepID=A0A9W7FPR7_9STRA|nr:hypothetical protein TrLO_g10827 [Triparma laevis f. longispina]
MGVTKARAERNALKSLSLVALTLPPHSPASPFWTGTLSSPTLISAPMVRHTDLPTRLQHRRYGAQLCYTSMIDADRYIAGDSASRSNYFTTNEDDQPLIAQFGATSASDFVEAAKLIEKDVNAVCLNLDCPQRRAKAQCFGAFLMRDRPEVVLDIIRRASKELKVPIVAKVRFLGDEPTVGNGYKSTPIVSKTLAFLKEMENAGLSMIVIHGRTLEMSNNTTQASRDNVNHRATHKSHWDGIAHVVPHLKIPVIANGDVVCTDDLEKCLETSKADGVMVATELMYNPGMFANKVKTRTRFTPLTQLKHVVEYLGICGEVGGFTPETLRSHVVDMVAVPCLSPERCRDLLGFGIGVEDLKTAWRRVLEIAVFLSYVCAGVDETVTLAQAKERVFKGRETFDVFEEVKKCAGWWLGDEGVVKVNGVGIDGQKVKEAFNRGNEVFVAWLGGERRIRPGWELVVETKEWEKKAKKAKKEKKAQKEKKEKKEKERIELSPKLRKKLVKCARKILQKSNEPEGVPMRKLAELVGKKRGVEVEVAREGLEGGLGGKRVKVEGGMAVLQNKTNDE